MMRDDKGLDKLDETLAHEEAGEVAGRLRAASEEIEPRPEFARQLEARLRQSARATERRPHTTTPNKQSGTLPNPTPRDTLPNKNRRSAIGRFTSLAMGLAGVAAVAVMLVGMAWIMRARQEGERGRQTPVAKALTPVGNPVAANSGWELVHTLPISASDHMATHPDYMAWSPDSRTLAATVVLKVEYGDVIGSRPPDETFEVKFRDTANGQLLGTATIMNIKSMTWLPKSDLLAIGRDENVVELRDRTGRIVHTLTVGNPPLDDMEAQQVEQGFVRSISGSPDGRLLAVASKDWLGLDVYEFGVVPIWDIATGQRIREIKVVPNNRGDNIPESSIENKWVSQVAWSPNGKVLVIQCVDSSIHTYDAISGELLHIFNSGRTDTNDSVGRYIAGGPKWSPNGDRLGLIVERSVEVYDSQSGRLLHVIPTEFPPTPVPTKEVPENKGDSSVYAPYGFVNAFEWHPSGRAITIGDTRTIKHWDAETGQLLFTVGSSASVTLGPSAWSADGQMLAAVVRDEPHMTVALFDLTGKELKRFAGAADFAWSTHGDMIALRDRDNITLWRLSEVELPPVPTSPALTPAPTTSALSSTSTPAPTIDAPTPTPSTSPASTPTPPCGEWQIVSSPPVDKWNELLAVDALVSDDVWAVGYYSASTVSKGNYFFSDYMGTGARALIMHWDGKAWERIPAPNPGADNNILQGVEVISKSEAWAVGSSTTGGIEQTLILRWDGVEWKQIPSPNPNKTRNRLFGITALSPTYIWAVGAHGDDFTDVNASQTLILRWKGEEWMQVPSPSPGAFGNVLYSVSASSSDNVWAVGVYAFREHNGVDKFILQWDGGMWKVEPAPEGANSLLGVSVLSHKDAWAVGALAMEGGSQLIILRWDGSQWVIVQLFSPDGVPHNHLLDISSVSSDNLWAVGYYYQPRIEELQVNEHTGTLIMHWDGVRWTRIPSPNAEPPTLLAPVPAPHTSINRLNAVAALPSGEVWAVGSTSGDGKSMDALVLRYLPRPCATPTPSHNKHTPTPSQPEPPQQTPTPPGVGDPAPDFTLPNVRGGEVKLSDLKGKPVVLTFWGTWCPPCRSQLDNLRQLYDKAGATGQVEFINISLGPRENIRDIRSFLDDSKTPYPWTFAHDNDSSVTMRYQVHIVPMIFFIDSSGIIRAIQTNIADLPQLEENLKLARP